MRQFITLLLLTSSISSTIVAQDKKFTMQEAVLGLRSNLAIQNLKQLSWLPGSENFVYLNDSTQSFIRTSLPSGKTDTFLTLSTINKIAGGEALKKMPPINWVTSGYFYFSKNGQYFKGINSNNVWYGNAWAKLPENAENIKMDKGATQIAYTVDNNLFLVDEKGNFQQVTNENDANIISGQSVHRNEFGIDGGIFFSPKSNLLAFYKMDQTMVADYPIIDWSVVPAINKNIKYPMSGQQSHHVQVGVYNPETKQTIYLQTGLPLDHYLTCVTWSPDEKNIYVAVLNREQNHMQLNKYDAITGAFIKTLFEEKNKKYVEPQHPLEFLPGKPSQFLWWSQKDNYMHLYRYDTSGKMLNAVTKGDWLVNDILGFDENNNKVIIVANKETPLGKNLYSVEWEKGTVTRLDKNDGVHNVSVSSNGKYFIDNFQNATTPRIINYASVDGKIEKNMLTATDPLATYERAQVRNVTLKAEDGTPLYGKLMLPAHFDSTKKHPVIVYLYNGPHVQLIQNSYPQSGNLWYELLTQKGYVVFSMDGRGSSNRGLEFEQATFRQLGTLEMDDQLKGVEYLKSLPYVDAERMGVHGWSFGGFMTTSLMLRHPDVFKCGVAGGPVIDWSMYEVMYTERYMDTPEENPKGYEANNLLTKTDKLKGKLLMIHGAQDDVVVWQHSINFIKACVDNGTQVDYFVYPGHPHNVQGKDRVHLMQKVTDYFDMYLK